MSDNEEQSVNNKRMGLSYSDLYRCTRRQGLERDEPSIPVEKLTKNELQSLVKSQTTHDIDVDFLLIKEQCNIFLSHAQVQEFFADCQCELHSTPYKEKVYSKSCKNILCIGRISYYKVGFILNSISETENNENAEDDNIAENSIEGNTVITVRMVKQFLDDYIQKLTKTFSFRVLSGVLQELFSESVIVIYRYGQKVPLADLKPKIVSMLSDCRLPIEIALGNQFKLENSFLSAYFTQSFKNTAYSNFLSNELCNIHIVNNSMAHTYHSLCFRLSLYNTWQHFKKNVSIQLEKTANSSDCFLRNFHESFFANDDKLKILLQKIDFSELRLEMYFSVVDLVQFREAISAIKLTLNKFTIAKCDMENIKSTFILYRKLSRHLFHHCQNCEDSTIFNFIIYYYKFHSFIYSTEKITEHFINNNIGMFLNLDFFKQNDLELTENLFNSITLPHLFSMLKVIFGNSKKSNLICTYYFFQYYLFFNRQIERELVLSRFVAEKIGFLLIQFNSISNEKLSFEKTFETLHTILQVLVLKYAKNVYAKPIVFYFVELSIVNNNVCKFLNEYLITNEFKIYYKNLLYVLGASSNAEAKVDFKSILSLSKSFTFNEFLAVHEKSKTSRSSIEDAFVRVFERLLSIFKEKIDQLTDDFFNTQCTFQKKKCLNELEEKVFMRFVFFSFPTGQKINIYSSFIKLVDIFTLIDAYLRFIYIGMVKYYLPREDCASEKISKYTGNFGVQRRYACKDKKSILEGVSCNRVLYFTGLFDNKYSEEGIRLPLPTKLYLSSRYGKQPHNLHDSLEDLLGLNGVASNYVNFPSEILGLFKDELYDSDVSQDYAAYNREMGIFTDDDSVSSDENSSSSGCISPEIVPASPESVPANEESVPASITPIEHSSLNAAVDSIPIQQVNGNAISVMNNGVLHNIEEYSIRKELEEALPLPNHKRFIDSLIENNITKEILDETDESCLVEYFTDMCGFSKIIATSIATQLKKKFRK